MPMATTSRRWTADDLDQLPDDGNRYEVVAGRLLVTPPPSPPHEAVVNALGRLLEAYVDSHALGAVFRRSDLRFDAHNRVDPDLSVIPIRRPGVPRAWRDAPRPVLLAEVLSPGTWRHDLEWKRDLYRQEQIPVAWIVDHEERRVHVVRPALDDVVVVERLVWQPEGAPVPFAIGLPAFFRQALWEE